MEKQRAALYAGSDAAAVEVVKSVLEGAGYEVHTTIHRKEALAQLEEFKPELVLIDIELETTNAFDLCKTIRSTTQPEHSPAVAFMATERTPDNVRQAIAAGGNFLIAKPVTSESLLAGVDKALQQHAATKKPAAATPAAAKPAARAAVGAVTGKNVLHVDDELLMRKLVRSVLENTGFKVASAGSSQEALAFLGKHPPNVILLDLNLGTENGFELCRAIRAQFPNLPAPVAFLTASRSPEDVQQCKQVGGDYFILKPFTATSLTDGINKAFIMRRKNLAAHGG